MRQLATIPVVTGPRTLAGRLHAYYDPDALLLILDSGNPEPPAFGFNVDGAVLFDCTTAGVLTRVMVNLRRELWQPSLAEPWRPDLPEADIIVDRSLQSRTVRGPVQCVCDAGRSSVIVRLGPAPWDSAVALSPGTAALLAGSTLVGLFVRDARLARVPFEIGASIGGVSV